MFVYCDRVVGDSSLARWRLRQGFVDLVGEQTDRTLGVSEVLRRVAGGEGGGPGQSVIPGVTVEIIASRLARASPRHQIDWCASHSELAHSIYTCQFSGLDLRASRLTYAGLEPGVSNCGHATSAQA